MLTASLFALRAFYPLVAKSEPTLVVFTGVSVIPISPASVSPTGQSSSKTAGSHMSVLKTAPEGATSLGARELLMPRDGAGARADLILLDAHPLDAPMSR